jgi:hypothetical protein
MLRNRSVPADIILPHITYRNVEDAMAWLTMLHLTLHRGDVGIDLSVSA